VPLEPAQDDPAAPEDDAFLLQTDPLRHHARHARATADAALRVDDTVPRDTVGAAQRLAHRPRRARLSEERRELSVRRDPAAWDPRDQREHGHPEAHAGAAPVCSS